MSLQEVIEAIDGADKAIRQELKLSGMPPAERKALERARDLLQRALTPLLKYQV